MLAFVWARLIVYLFNLGMEAQGESKPMPWRKCKARMTAAAVLGVSKEGMFLQKGLFPLIIHTVKWGERRFWMWMYSSHPDFKVCTSGAIRHKPEEWQEECRSWALKREGGIEMVQPVQAMESSWLTRPWSVAQIFSALKSLSNLTEVAGSSSDLSHLLTSARDLSQTVEIYISAPLQWWKICFISLWCGATCCLGTCSGKAKLRAKGLSGFA